MVPAAQLLQSVQSDVQGSSGRRDRGRFWLALILWALFQLPGLQADAAEEQVLFFDARADQTGSTNGGTAIWSFTSNTWRWWFQNTSQAAVSPNGKLVAYVYLDRLYLTDIRGRSPKLISIGGILPAWSPEGDRIAFLRRDDTLRKNVLIIASSSGTVLSTHPNGASASRPSWSPDGTKIAVTDNIDVEEVGCDFFENGCPAIRTLGTIYVYDLATGTRKPLWTPTYISSEGEKWKASPNTIFTTILSTQTRLHSPVWSPDGEFIAAQRVVWRWHTRPSGKDGITTGWKTLEENVVLLPSAGGEPIPVTTDLNPIPYLLSTLRTSTPQAWSDDGRLFYTRTRGASLPASEQGTFATTGTGPGTAVNGFVGNNVQWATLNRSGIKLEILPPKSQFRTGENFDVLVRVTSYEDTNVTIRFKNALAASDAPDRVEVKPTLLPESFVLTVQQPVRTFKVPMTAKAKGRARLSSEVTAIVAAGAEQNITTSTNVQVYPAGDLLIKGFEEPATAFGGNDVYQTVAGGPQIRTATSGLRDTNRFSIRVENDSREPASFVLRVKTSDASKWRLGLKQDGLDITGTLLSPAGWPTPLLDAGGSIEVVLQAESVSAEVADRLIVTSFLSTVEDPETVDTVSAVVNLVAVPVAAVMKHAGESGYLASSINAGKSNVDAPLELVANRLLLDQQPSIYGGWVADGVTPLLLRFHASDAALQPFPDGRKFALEITVDAGGALEGLPISKRLRVLKNATWATDPSFRLDATTNTAFAMLAAVRSDDVQLSSGRQLKLLVIVKDVVADQEAGRLEIPLRKPPIALIHGYNTGGDWADPFLLELSRSRPLPSEDPNWISIARYGQNRGNGRAPFVTQWENTLLPLATLVPLAGQALEDAVAPLRDNWAFTRFDVICHSQGGLLTRMLCSEQSDDALQEPFRNAANHFRGRFHRVVTIGSPHNGTRLLRYLLSLDSTKMSLLKNNLPALIGRIGVLSEVAQAKFDPFGAEIRDLNSASPDSRWKPDSAAKFHLIRTTVNLGQPPYVENLAPSYVLLGLDHPVGGPLVLPRGSDGVVDFDSMGANGPGQPLPANVFTLAPALLVSHAPVEVLGAAVSQTEAALVAAHAIAALDQDSSLPESDRTFSNFTVPALLGDDVRDAIDRWADQTVFEFLRSAINPVPPSPRLQDATGGDAPLVRVVLSIPANLPNTNAVSWFAEVYSADGIGSSPVELRVDKADSRKVSVRIPGGLVGDVVLHAHYKTTNGAVVLVEPRRIYSAEPVGASLVGVDVDPDEITLPPGARVPVQLWTRYSDGRRVLRHLLSSEVTVESSSPGVVSIVDPLEWRMEQPGQSTLTVHYRGQTAISRVTVSAPGTPGPPVLQVGLENGQVRLSWPAASAGFVLEQAPSLPPGSWSPTASTPAIVGAEKVVTLPAGDTAQFYRLRQQ